MMSAEKVLPTLGLYTCRDPRHLHFQPRLLLRRDRRGQLLHKFVDNLTTLLDRGSVHAPLFQRTPIRSLTVDDMRNFGCIIHLHSVCPEKLQCRSTNYTRKNSAHSSRYHQGCRSAPHYFVCDKCPFQKTRLLFRQTIKIRNTATIKRSDLYPVADHTRTILLP